MTIQGTQSLSLASKCQVSVERIVLDLESETMRGPGSIPTGGNILSLGFFSHSKAPDANIANFVNLRKTRESMLLHCLAATPQCCIITTI